MRRFLLVCVLAGFIHIKNGGVLTSPAESAITITAATIIIDEGSRIDVSGKGLLADAAGGTHTGGSHGGKGGNYSSFFSLGTYGSYHEPVPSVAVVKIPTYAEAVQSS